jgi:hypothetical protein
MGLAASEPGDEFFPAESFFDVYYKVEFPEAPMAIVADGELPPHLEAVTPIDSLPPYLTDHVDYDYAPFSEASSPKAYVAWIRSHLRMLPHPDDTCYADGDVNGDGVALAVQDLVYLVDFVFAGGFPPDPLYRGDLNGDCHVDQRDVEVLYCFMAYGMVCFPIYPVPTCCYPDTVRGACCDYQLDSCLVLAPENCDLIGGGYMGDGAACDPDLCQQVCDCVPGNADGEGSHNILDVTHIINYLYKEGPAPIPYEACSGDADCNCIVNILDVTYLINYLYKEGPEPCLCETWVSGCGPLQK